MIKNENHSFGVVVHIRGLPEKVAELRRHLIGLAYLTRHEDGCISCEMIENGCDTTEFTLLEEWSNMEAHNVHFKTKEIIKAMSLIKSLLSEEVDRCKHVLRLNSVRYGTNSYCLAVS